MHPSCLLALCLLSPALAQRRPLLSSPIPTVQPTFQPTYQPTYRPQQPPSDIVSQISDGPNPDGSFYTKFETANGITFEEQGQLTSNGQIEAERVQGAASWVDPEGQRISISWVADENGANFQGDHLPTPPPIPEAIQRALAWIAANPSRDNGEGQYREEEYNDNRLTTLNQIVLPTTRRPPPRG